jgi:hypothetical protein
MIYLLKKDLGGDKSHINLTPGFSDQPSVVNMLVSRWSLPRAPDRQWIAGASGHGRCHGRPWAIPGWFFKILKIC